MKIKLLYENESYLIRGCCFNVYNTLGFGHKEVVYQRALEEEFLKRGYTLCFGGTDNHLLLIDLTNKGITGKEAQIALDKAGITLNKNMVPNDPRSPMDPSGIRLGTPALTTRGMKEEEMRTIANWIDEVVMNYTDENKLASLKGQVTELTKKFPLYPNLK